MLRRGNDKKCSIMLYFDVDDMMLTEFNACGMEVFTVNLLILILSFHQVS